MRSSSLCCDKYLLNINRSGEDSVGFGSITNLCSLNLSSNSLRQRIIRPISYSSDVQHSSGVSGASICENGIEGLALGINVFHLGGGTTPGFNEESV